MKHLKQFENNTQVYFIVKQTNFDDGRTYLQLFEKEEDAILGFLESVNMEKKKKIMRKRKFTDNDIIIDLVEAVKWSNENLFDTKIDYDDIQLRTNHEFLDKSLGEKIKLKLAAKKYNI